ncbi:MAG: alpha/beta hydrolase domain-containing protein [Thermodesulfobacteriota bacterium]
MSHTSIAAVLVTVLAAWAATPPAARAETAPRCARTVRNAPASAAAADVLPACRPMAVRFERSSVPSPVIEEPGDAGRGTPTVSGTSFDLGEQGYEQAEFFLSGEATSYAAAGPLRADGRWRVVRSGTTAPYKTRIVVYRPIDPARFSGTVVVEWLNVSGGLDAAPDWIALHTEIVRTGDVWVGVSAQFVGVEGPASPLTPLVGGLKTSDPERYGTLSHPGDSFSYDIYSQAGQALRAPNGPDPLGGLEIRKLIAAGESQSAFRMVTYVNAVDPLARVYDGFLVHSRGGGSAPLAQDPLPPVATPEVVRIRGDVRVPVLTFQTETDLVTLGFLPDRQPDGRNIRLWEAAGTAHADTYTLGGGWTDVGDDPSVAEVRVTAAPIPGIIECDSPVNSGPQHWVLKAAYAALERWIGGGPPPTRAMRLELEDGEFVLDEHGNVRGGIRTSYVDAPTATLSGLGQTGGSFCRIFGTTMPFSAAEIDALYPSNADYVAAVRRSNERAVRAGFLLRADAELIEAWAVQNGRPEY